MQQFKVALLKLNAKKKEQEQANTFYRSDSENK